MVESLGMPTCQGVRVTEEPVCEYGRCRIRQLAGGSKPDLPACNLISDVSASPLTVVVKSNETVGAYMPGHSLAVFRPTVRW